MIEAGSLAELAARGWAPRLYDIMDDTYSFPVGGGRSITLHGSEISEIRIDTWKPEQGPALVVYSIPDIEAAAAAKRTLQ